MSATQECLTTQAYVYTGHHVQCQNTSIIAITVAFLRSATFKWSCENRLKVMSRCTCGSPNALPTRLPMAFFAREIAYPHSGGSVKNRA
jgi:hypothetical protein